MREARGLLTHFCRTGMSREIAGLKERNTLEVGLVKKLATAVGPMGPRIFDGPQLVRTSAETQDHPARFKPWLGLNPRT